MKDIDTLWLSTGIIIFLLIIFIFREILLVSRIPARHPDRGLYWFNVLFLMFFICGVVYAAWYIDTNRKFLQQLIAVPSSAQYAITRNHLIHNATWIYASNESEEDIRNFYRNYANEKDISFLEDNMRMSFELPSGHLFLTLSQENNKTILYFSRDGEIYRVTR